MLPAEQSYFSIFFFAWKQYGEHRCRLFFTFYIYPEEIIQQDHWTSNSPEQNPNNYSEETAKSWLKFNNRFSQEYFACDNLLIIMSCNILISVVHLSSWKQIM